MTVPLMRFTALSLGFFGLLACSSKVPVGGYEGGGGQTAEGGGGGGQGLGGAADGGGGAGGTGGEGGYTGETVDIRFRSSTAPFTHTDGYAGQTPNAHTSGIRSLTLYRTMGDPDPYEVFDFGQDSIAVDYADGADTHVFTAKVADFPEGNFTVARVVQSWVKYNVDATMHYAGFHIPGVFDNMQVLSDGSLVDGTLRDAGYYEYVYTGNGMDFPVSGDNAPIPEFTGGGFTVVFENGEWAYYFPVTLPLSPDVASSYVLTFDVNMFESFRWQDQAMPDYTTSIFDVTPTSFEPVTRFGANSFGMSIEQ